MQEEMKNSNDIIYKSLNYIKNNIILMFEVWQKYGK